MCGNTISSTGSWISPPPPTIESVSPARNAAAQRITSVSIPRLSYQAHRIENLQLDMLQLRLRIPRNTCPLRASVVFRFSGRKAVRMVMPDHPDEFGRLAVLPRADYRKPLR